MKKLVVVLLVIAIAFTVQLAFGKKIPENGILSKKAKKILPTVDGKLDDVWQRATPLKIEAEVPSYDQFDKVYWGQKYTVTLRSMYNDTDIYFFVQWIGDDASSYARESWYYNDKENKWMQKPKSKSDAYSPPVYEDKFAFMWEVGDSVPNFAKDGGSLFCHGSKKYTASKSEKMDIWHWKLVRTGPVDQVDDKWLTFNGDGENGRTSDEGSGAYKTNKQEITKNGKTYSIPAKWIPGKSDYHWIMADDASARKIVDIDTNRNLIDEDGTVISIENFLMGSPNIIPSIMEVKPATGSRGDVAVVEYYDDATKTWNLEIKRARVTGNDDDVQFSDTKASYDFSVAVFNAAAIAHATPGGLSGRPYVLIFK